MSNKKIKITERNMKRNIRFKKKAVFELTKKKRKIIIRFIFLHHLIIILFIIIKRIIYLFLSNFWFD